MRFSWDPAKDELLRKNKSRGGIGFDDVISMFRRSVAEVLRSDEPEQFVAIGWVNTTLYSLVFEEREDEIGPLRHLVTFWPSSKEEEKLYVERTR